MHMETTDYNKQATDFLEKHGLTFKAEFVGKNCPPWAGDTERKTKHGCPKCGVVHGWEYRITLAKGRQSISFPFWNSWADTHIDCPKGKYEVGNWVWFEDKKIPTELLLKNVADTGSKLPSAFALPPSAYDALASISPNTYCETSFEDWCDEFDYDKDSRRAEAMHKRCMEFALQLRQFFTDAEIEDLREIQ